MNGIVILSLVVIVGSGDASAQRSASPGDRLGAIPFPVVRGSQDTSKNSYSDGGFEQKCEGERGICRSHCSALGYAGGGCIDDSCYCHSGRSTTFECDRIILIGEKVTAEKQKSCDVLCRLLGKDFSGGECVGGKCRCTEERRGEKRNKMFMVPTSYWQQTYRR